MCSMRLIISFEFLLLAWFEPLPLPPLPLDPDRPQAVLRGGRAEPSGAAPPPGRGVSLRGGGGMCRGVHPADLHLPDGVSVCLSVCL